MAREGRSMEEAAGVTEKSAGSRSVANQSGEEGNIGQD